MQCVLLDVVKVAAYSRCSQIESFIIKTSNLNQEYSLCAKLSISLPEKVFKMAVLIFCTRSYKESIMPYIIILVTGSF